MLQSLMALILAISSLYFSGLWRRLLQSCDLCTLPFNVNPHTQSQKTQSYSSFYTNLITNLYRLIKYCAYFIYAAITWFMISLQEPIPTSIKYSPLVAGLSLEHCPGNNTNVPVNVNRALHNGVQNVNKYGFLVNLQFVSVCIAS